MSDSSTISTRLGAVARRRPPSDSSAAKRFRILEAAREVCSASGVDAARMEEIAARAGVSKGTLYNFFESKDALVIETMAHAFDSRPLLSRDEPTHAESARKRLEWLLAELRRPFERVSSLMPVGFQGWALAVRDPMRRDQLATRLRESYRRNEERLASVLESARRAGELPVESDVDAIATALIATFDGLLYRSAFDPENANPDTLRAVHDALVRALFAPRGDAG